MNEGSGGIGAVSVNISHPIALMVLILLVVVLAFGGWKLLKALFAASGG
jgi:hypothetical protein